MFSTAKDNDMVECPYNKYHRMARKRLQPHLIKCRLSYPDAELCKCPFNASHLIPEPEFTHHVTNCPDKALITQYKYNALPLKKDEEDRKQLEVECDDNWDDTEANDYDPKAYASQANVIRSHIGDLPSARKVFRKTERKRLGDEDTDSSEDEADKKYGKKIYKDLDCKKEEDDQEKYGWYEDLGTTATNKAHGSRNSESDGRYKRPVKLEQSDEDGAQSKRPREEKYHLDDDPYYKSNSVDRFNGSGRRGGHFATLRGASRRQFY